MAPPIWRSYHGRMTDALRALKAQLKKELAATTESLEFWRAQPPSGIIPHPGVADLSVGRVAHLEEEVADLERLIIEIEVDDA